MTAPNADQQVYNEALGLDPTDDTGYAQYWMSRVRARKKLGDNVNKDPYTRTWTVNGVTTNVVASPSDQDKGTAVADALGWRRVNPETAGGVIPAVTDVGDKFLVMWEFFCLWAAQPSNLAMLTQAVANAEIVADWPTGYTGNASFDTP